MERPECNNNKEIIYPGRLTSILWVPQQSLGGWNNILNKLTCILSMPSCSMRRLFDASLPGWMIPLEFCRSFPEMWVTPPDCKREWLRLWQAAWICDKIEERWKKNNGYSSPTTHLKNLKRRDRICKNLIKTKNEQDMKTQEHSRFYFWGFRLRLQAKTGSVEKSMW